MPAVAKLGILLLTLLSTGAVAAVGVGAHAAVGAGARGLANVDIQCASKNEYVSASVPAHQLTDFSVIEQLNLQRLHLVAIPSTLIIKHFHSGGKTKATFKAILTAVHPIPRSEEELRNVVMNCTYDYEI